MDIFYKATLQGGKLFISIKLISTVNPSFVCAIWVETRTEEGNFKM